MLSSRLTNPIVYLSLLAFHVGLVWMLPYFPSQDGPSHLYNLVILHDLLNGGTEWGSYFTNQIRAVPNFGFHIFAYPLLSFCSALTAEKIFISIYVMLMGVSVPVFLRVFERPVFPFAFCAVPVILNFTLLKGFYSYAIGVPLLLLACALAWKIRNGTVVTKALVYNLSAIVLFYVHLLPFIFYVSFLVALVMALNEDRRRLFRALPMLLLTLSPVLFNLSLYLAQGASGYRSDFSSLFSLGRIDKLVADLVLFSTVNLSSWQLLPASLFMVIVLICGYRPLKALVTAWTRGEAIAAGEKTLLVQAGSLTLVYLFFHGVYFNERFPWVILLTVLPLLRMPEEGLISRHVTVALAAVVTVHFVVTAGLMRQQSASVESFVRGLEHGVPKGAFVMTFKRSRTDWSRIDALMHAASYYGIFGGCVDIGNYETGLYQFPVRFRQGLGTLPHPKQVGYAPESVEWRDYPSIRYLLGWEVDTKDREGLRKYFHLVWGNGGMTVWERNFSGA